MIKPAPNEPATGAIDVSWIPAVPFMRVHQFAKFFSVSNGHVLSLIREGSIKVPKALQESAPSGPAMRIPRASIIKFVRQRSSLAKHKRRLGSGTRKKEANS